MAVVPVAACASVLLLAVTNKICEDIAVVPFLWVLPLSAYLLSFIVSFDNPRWYGRGFWLPALALALGASLCVMLSGKEDGGDAAVLAPVRWLFAVAEDLSIFKVIGIYLGTLFIACMVCHGELYRLRPAPRKLTTYYLTVAAGGAFGGIFVAVLARGCFRTSSNCMWVFSPSRCWRWSRCLLIRKVRSAMASRRGRGPSCLWAS